MSTEKETGKLIKLVFCLHRLPHLSTEAFRDYWWTSHAPLVKQHAPALRIARYVQSHGLEHEFDAAMQASRDAQPRYDGFAELWWASEDDLRAAMSEPHALAAGKALLEDERKFIDLKRSSLTFVRECPVVE